MFVLHGNDLLYTQMRIFFPHSMENFRKLNKQWGVTENVHPASSASDWSKKMTQFVYDLTLKVIGVIY